ncbi:MAG TPA: DNA polymerase III subunit delta [Actinomycetota bacterium]|nr:DNA polymerase III subunit delta [Actinomycetota bacterium]
MTPSSRLAAPVHLLWGEDAFLLREAAFEIFGDLRPREVDGAEWSGGEAADLATPSLFGERRALLVSNARGLQDEGMKELARYLEAPDAEASLILLAAVGERAKAPAALVKLVKPVGTITEVRVQRRDLPSWLQRRAEGKSLDLAPDGATALIERVGQEPGALEQALGQLAAAFPGKRIGSELVARQFRGLGEQQVWDLCDRAFARDLPRAMRSLRTLLESNEAGLLILGSITARLRDLIRVKSLPERLPPAELARQAGLRFDWQARRYRDMAARFSTEELLEMHGRLTWADRTLKSGATDDVVLPLVVTSIAGEPIPIGQAGPVLRSGHAGSV